MARKKKAVPTGEVKPMRRNNETGELAPPARGRPTGDWVRGYVDAEGTFHEGDVPKKRGKRGRKPGRPKGSTNKKTAKAAKGVKGGALSAQLQRIIDREVSDRLAGLHKEIATAVRSKVLADLAG